MGTVMVLAEPFFDQFQTDNSIIFVYTLRRISTRRNEQRFRRQFAMKLVRHETLFNFRMNNFDTIIENITNELSSF